MANNLNLWHDCMLDVEIDNYESIIYSNAKIDANEVKRVKPVNDIATYVTDVCPCTTGRLPPWNAVMSLETKVYFCKNSILTYDGFQGSRRFKESKILHSLQILQRLPVTYPLLQYTGIFDTVMGLQDIQNPRIENAVKQLIEKWNTIESQHVMSRDAMDRDEAVELEDDEDDGDDEDEDDEEEDEEEDEDDEDDEDSDDVMDND